MQTNKENKTWGTWITKYLLPNPGTLIVLVLFIWVQNVGAAPWFAPLAASSTTSINYQGRLFDNSGNSINTNVTLEFSLYNQASSGSRLWGPETHSGVQVSDGLFSVLLGNQTPIPQSALGGNLWLQIKVNGETLSPREQLAAVPIAMTVPDDSITAAKIASNAVGSAEVANNSLTSSDLASNSVGASEIASGAVGSSEVADNSITTSDLAPDSVGAGKIKSGAVGSSEIANGAVTQAKAPSLLASQWSNRKVIVATWVGNLNSNGEATINIAGYNFTWVDGIVAVNGDDTANQDMRLNVRSWGQSNTSSFKIRGYRSNGSVASNQRVRLNFTIMGQQ